MAGQPEGIVEAVVPRFPRRDILYEGAKPEADGVRCGRARLSRGTEEMRMKERFAEMERGRGAPVAPPCPVTSGHNLGHRLAIS